MSGPMNKMLHSRDLFARSVVAHADSTLPSPIGSCPHNVKRGAFTLIELFVVMATIGILLGLAFPAFTSVQNSARKTQAKNDLVQIVTAVNAFYTEYGKYPTAATTDAGALVGPGGTSTLSLFNELRGIVGASINLRQIVFISPQDAKDQNNPQNGIKTSDGQLYDPWGTPYAVDMDANYDNQIANPYTIGAGSTPLRNGVIAWSFGKDKTSSTVPGPAANKAAGTALDDVISWQ